ncbi:suppressor of cytokine signaling 2-like [Portunus trituberculatus]|uniref:suppressor of cytokine signaling 2-like n=1 Tax=Portunus trituberculatus TaxID=210409 RepID=UPI001E1CD5F6|nr:suppressor of cytokine signaling 2-like [Portunus trituberculatus]
MLTCPNCHHVLATRPCCSITLQCPASAPPMSTLAPPAAGGPLMGSSLGSAPLHLSTNAASASTEQQHHTLHSPQQPQAPLATPHVSGHMFHFPTLQMPSFVGCHSPCHMTCQGAMPPPCSTACRSPAVCGGGWRWPDSGGRTSDHSLATRMHTSGGGIVDASSMAKAGVEEDSVVASTRRALVKSGWYWERITWREAEALLQGTSLGTFIVRDSADMRFLFSLSVQTERGPTSVRIHYSGGKFRLDCEAHMAPTIPEFSHVIRLVEHYIRINRKLQRHVWVDTRGQIYSPITIRQPLKRNVAPLKHLCRLAINQSFHQPATCLPLPAPLAAYIDEYPFWC